ncbi:MAG: hypothetical protein GY940_27595 [bacterium]|nr:hypothetical protein [bacterium]
MKKNQIKSIITGLCIFLLPVMVSAGFLLEDSSSGQFNLGLRFFHPNFEAGNNFSALSGTYDISLSVPLSRGLSIKGVLPVATVSSDGESESEVGNIYVGLQKRLMAGRSQSLSISAGVFLPTLGDFDNLSASVMGFYSNYLEFFKYMPETMTFYGNVSYYRGNRSGLMFGFEAGPYVVTDQSEFGDTVILLHYGVTAGYRASSVLLKAEFAGIATFEDGGLGVPFTSTANEPGKTFNAVAFGLQWNYRNLRPGLFYKLYLREDMRDVVKSVVGFKLDISFRTRRY